MPRKDRVVQRITELLKQEFKPSKLYLFGSRANGTVHGESDYDFVMVLPHYKGDRMKTWEKCNELIRRQLGFQVDVFVYSEKGFERSKAEFNSIAEMAFSIGKEIDLGSP
jgi:DNA polymerase sigma